MTPPRVPLAVRDFFASNAIAPGPIVVACSGGVDSTALLLAFENLRQGGFVPLAAHVNHHLRGEESDGDERFLRDLCARLALRCEVRDGTLDSELIRRSGIEAAARTVRERLLLGIARAEGIAWIATAHQRNDQAETVLMRMSTGTGLQGLRAIHPVREDGFVRPLLDCTRTEIIRYLAECGVEARHDRSNDDRRFLRNRVRAAIRDLGDDAIAGIARVATEAAELWRHVEGEIDRVEEKYLREANETESRFSALPPDRWIAGALLLRHVRRLGSSRDVSSASLGRLVTSTDGRVSVTKDVEFIRSGDQVILRRREEQEPAESYRFTIVPGERVRLPDGSAVSLRCASDESPLANADHTSQCFAVPRGTGSTFTVRNRVPGDRVRLLGAPGTRKLKDVFIDRRIEVAERDFLPLLLYGDQIVWVAGVGVSELFKVTDAPELDLYEVVYERERPNDSH